MKGSFLKCLVNIYMIEYRVWFYVIIKILIVIIILVIIIFYINIIGILCIFNVVYWEVVGDVMNIVNVG